jgi:hypothetical protein
MLRALVLTIAAAGVCTRGPIGKNYKEVLNHR